MSSWSVRPAEANDLPDLSELVRDEVRLQRELAGVFELAPDVDWRAFVSAKLERPDTGLLVAHREGQLVGYVEVRVQDREAGRGTGGVGARLRGWLRRARRAGRAGVVEDVYVAPGARGSRCGATLLEQGLHWLERRGAREVFAGIWARNDDSLGFFGQQGFQPLRVTLRRGVDGDPRPGAGE